MSRRKRNIIITKHINLNKEKKAHRILSLLEIPMVWTMVKMLAEFEGELNVTEIVIKMAFKNPHCEVSKYLGCLREHELVICRKEGILHYYSINVPNFEKICIIIKKLSNLYLDDRSKT